MKVLLFLAFLISYGLWAWGSSSAMKKLQADLLTGKSFWSGQLVSMLPYFGFFSFLYLLSGFWNLQLALLVVVTTQIGFLIALLVNGMLGAQSEATGMRGAWAGAEFNIKHPLMNKIYLALGFVLYISYPVVAGIALFQHAWSSDVLKILIIKYSLLLLIFAGYPAVIIVMIMMLVSENLDEDTRQRFFVNQLAGMIPTALFVAFAVWAFGIGGVGVPLDFAALSGTLSFRALILLLLFFAFSIVVPYFLGTKRAKRRVLALLREKRNYVARLTDILESPTGPLYVPKLTQLCKEVADARSKLTSEDSLLRTVEQIEAAPTEIPAVAKPFIDALEKTRGLDPRFSFVDHLTKFETEVQEVVEDLRSRSGSDVVVEAELWSKKFGIRKAELTEEIKANEKAKPPIVGGLGALAVMIVSPILSEVGKAAWLMVLHSSK